jgi:ParB family chromosome partitioning protein
MQLPDGKTRLDLIREGLVEGGLKKRGRLVVAIDRLKEDAKNERRTFRNMEGLIASVKAVGLIEPITVTAEEGQDGVYRIITGHRRFRAAKAAGISQVEVLIREPDDELTRRVKSIISNVQREDVGPVEMAEALQALIDEDERVKTQDDLARMIGKDKTWVSGMLRILTIPTALQQRVGASQLSVPYDSMIKVARLDDPQHQEQLIEAVLSGASMREVREQINQIKGKSKTPGTVAIAPKPKRVYHTEHHATVIVQATRAHLSSGQVIEALRQALEQARKA